MTNNKKGLDFEVACKNKLAELGFVEISITRNTDFGADIIATLGTTKYVFQCKNHQKKQGNSCVQEVVGAQKIYHANRSCVISNSGFTKQAFQQAYPHYCRLLTGDEFFNLDNPHSFVDNVEHKNDLIYDPDYDIFSEYEKIKLKIGHTPRHQDLSRTLDYKIRKKYGNLNNFIKSVGDIPYTVKPSNNEIKSEYKRIRDLIEKKPTLEDVSNNSKFSRNCFSTYPFTKLQKECGDSPNIERNISKEKLIEEFRKLEAQLGRFPSQTDLNKFGIYRTSYYIRRWGNYNSFLEDIGITRSQVGLPRQYSKEDILILYGLIKLLLSHREEKVDFNVNHTVLENTKYKDKPIISPSTISNKWGTWDKFLTYLKEIDFESYLVIVKEKLNDLIIKNSKN